MAGIDLSKIRVGDEVLVRANVCGDGRGDGVITVDFGGSVRVCVRERIVSHAPKALAVGDRVRNRHCKAFPPGYPGAPLLAIHGQWGGVEFVQNSPSWVLLSDLERADA